MSNLRRYVEAARSRLWLVVLAYAFRTGVALTLAWPLAKVLAPDNVMALPQMDRELFFPGARVLLHVLFEQNSRLLTWLHRGWMLGAAVALVGTLGATVLLCALARPPGTRASVLLRDALRNLPATIAVTATGWLAFVAVALTAKLALRAVPAVVYPLVGEKGADAALAIGILGLALAALLTFTITDLARAAAVVRAAGTATALSIGFGSLARRPRACLAGSAGYFAASLALPACVAILLPDPSSTSRALVLGALAHQLTVLGVCALHLGWWALATRIVRTPPIQNHESPNEDSLD